MHAALHPASVASLTLIGTPTDFDKGPKLLRMSGHPGKALGLGAARMLVALNHGALPGATAVAGMLAADLPALSKRTANAAFAPTAGNDRGLLRWLIAPQAIPGGLYLWLLEHVVFDNGLVRGSIRVGGRAVELSAIQCPVFLLAGSDDAVAPAGQVFALRHRVSTSKDQTLRLLAQAGHLDLFTAPEVLRGPWLSIIRHIQQLPGG
jgi:poly(3-hydroxyalkanoate) synthetase